MARERDAWKLIRLSVEHADRVLLYGPPGTGKTHIAKTFGDPDYVQSITLHEDSTVSELEGFYRPKGDVFEWQDGYAIRTWRKGGRLVLNEIDKASGDVLTMCYAILDDPELAELTIGSGETVKPMPGFTVVATMNGHPMELPEALADRFDAIIPVNEVNPVVYDAMPRDLRLLARSKVVQERVLANTNSIRSILSFGRLRTRMGEVEAAQVVFGDHAEEVVDALRIVRAAAKIEGIEESEQKTLIDGGSDRLAHGEDIDSVAEGLVERSDDGNEFGSVATSVKPGYDWRT